MNITLLAAANSIHTAQWANNLLSYGHQVHVISQQPATECFAPNIKTYVLPNRGALGYFLMVPAVKKLLARIKPDIVHAHFASGYGTTARLVAYHPYVLSVWGSDVYDFPYKSILHRWIVKKNLLAADQITSTSHCMADQVRRLIPDISNIHVVPFGVHLVGYKNIQSLSSAHKNRLVIGTVKTMARKYGIDTLIEAYAILLKRLSDASDNNAVTLELRLVGDGGQITELKALTKKLGIANSVHFVGNVPHKKVPEALANIDIYAALSRQESFGVAVIEAGAAARPVVVSDAGGLPEVVIHGETGLVVPRENPEAAAIALEKLVLDATLRRNMGEAGHHHVAKHYAWTVCIKKMIDVYEKTISKNVFS